MNELRELYREVILDHNRHPRNFGDLDNATRVVEGVNPLCGDRLTVYVKLRNGEIEDIKFKGTGCAISVASASIMTEKVKGTAVNAALDLFDRVHHMLMGDAPGENGIEEHDKLAALSGVREFPSRVKCASLGWHALKAAVTGHDEHISTE